MTSFRVLGLRECAKHGELPSSCLFGSLCVIPKSPTSSYVDSMSDHCRNLNYGCYSEGLTGTVKLQATLCLEKCRFVEETHISLNRTVRGFVREAGRR